MTDHQIDEFVSALGMAPNSTLVGPSEIRAFARRLLEAQAREIEALQADAEQYRWLRAQHWNDGALCVIRPVDLPLGVRTFSGTLLDDAIAVRRMAANTTAEGGVGEHRN